MPVSPSGACGGVGAGSGIVTVTSLDLPDVPAEFVPIIVEVAQPDGPYGARGMGEHTMIPAAPIEGRNAVAPAPVW